MLTHNKYSNEMSWKNYMLVRDKVCSHFHDRSWDKMFACIYEMKEYEVICDILYKLTNKSIEIYPKPRYVFEAFRFCSLDKIKVVIIGQDPYFNPGLAMGLSFSIPYGCNVPSSLLNIYLNLKKYGHLQEIPDHGNLEFWADQGCLMLNSSLTVIEGRDNANCHEEYWKKITDYVIKYVSENNNGVIFVLWGKYASTKLDLINTEKHQFIISSHPSGFSCNNKLGKYESFANTDFAKYINDHLKKMSKTPIIWSLPKY